MSSPTRHSKRLVLQYAAVQMLCAALSAVVCWMVIGHRAATGALIGGLIVALGSVVFGWQLFAGRGWPPRDVTRSLYLGEIFKWIWVLGAFWLALRYGGLPPLALLSGMLVGQIGFWIAIWFFKRG